MEAEMSTDPLNVTRLRQLAQNARDSAKNAREPAVNKQYKDIAAHYDFLIESIVAAAARKDRASR
jgi:hypothetical protein